MNIMKKIRVDRYGIFRSDVYFNKYLLGVEIDEKGHSDSDPIFEERRQKALEKNMVVNLLEKSWL